jgi:hypothetical protein
MISILIVIPVLTSTLILIGMYNVMLRLQGMTGTGSAWDGGPMYNVMLRCAGELAFPIAFLYY